MGVLSRRTEDDAQPDFRIELEYPPEAAAELQEAYAQVQSGAEPAERLLEQVVGTLSFVITSRTGYGEWSEWVALMVGQLLHGIPDLLDGQRAQVFGMYTRFCFNLDPTGQAVYMSMEAGGYEDLEEIMEEEGEAPPDIPLTVWSAPQPGTHPPKDYRWRRFEFPIRLERYVAECFGALDSLVAFCSSVLGDECCRQPEITGLLADREHARQAWVRRQHRGSS